jgi:hypothetical protein
MMALTRANNIYVETKLFITKKVSRIYEEEVKRGEDSILHDFRRSIEE